MKRNIKTTFNQFTQEMINKGLEIRSIKKRQLKDKTQLLLKVSSLKQPAIFNWNEDDKRWLLSKV